MAPSKQRRGRHQLAVEDVGKSIVRGNLLPGEDVDPVGMEETFGVSRTVIRDALRVLVEKGLVEARPGLGTRVRPRVEWNLLDRDVLRWEYEERADDQFLSDLAEVRAVIEPAGARLAAERRSEDDLVALRDAAAILSRAEVHTAEAVEADLAFHRALLVASHNELLQHMELVIEPGLHARNLAVHSHSGQERWAEVVEQHLEVLRAVEARRGTAAERAMRRIVRTAREDDSRLRKQRQRKPKVRSRPA